MHFFRLWTAGGLSTALLLACDTRPVPECTEQQGTIVAPWAAGVEAVAIVEFPNPRPVLLARADRVEARTFDDKLIPCGGVGTHRYGCKHSAGLKKIIVHIAGQTRTLPGVCPAWPREDEEMLILEDLPVCVADGTTVVEGDLLGHDPALATPTVHLEGPPQVFTHFWQDGFTPRIECSVADGHYACPTLGFRYTATHTIIAGGVRTEVSLPVEDCEATKVELDVTCPDLPTTFLVQAPISSSSPVRASYEGGASYECRPALRGAFPQPTTGTHDFLCPPAPGDERGRGRYEVVALDSG